MPERTKELEELRRLADLLQQAVTAATDKAATAEKKLPRIRRVQATATPSEPGPQTESEHPDARKRRWGA